MKEREREREKVGECWDEEVGYYQGRALQSKPIYTRYPCTN